MVGKKKEDQIIKTEIFLTYQKPQEEQPYVMLTMEDFLTDGRVLIHTVKITKKVPDQYYEEVTQYDKKLPGCLMERMELMNKYGDYLIARIIGHLETEVKLNGVQDRKRKALEKKGYYLLR